MRKIFLCLILTVLLVFTSANAAYVEITDVNDDVIRVYGDAEEGTNVSILILNPGFTQADVVTNGKDAIAYCERTKAGNSGFSHDVGMYDADKSGGKYTLITSDENSETGDEVFFNFYFADEKLDLIDRLATEDADSLVEEFFLKNTLSDNEIYKTTPLDVIKEVFERETEFERDIDKMYDYLSDTLCIAAYKSGNEKLIESGEIMYADIIGAKDTEIYSDYLGSLSDDGRYKVNKKLLGKDYESTDEILESFNELVLLHAICDNKELGFGHVKDLLEKYEEEYKDFGIDPEKIEKVTNQNNAYKALATSDAETMKDLKKAFDKATEDKEKPSSGGGGGGGGGSSSSSNTEKPTSAGISSVPSSGPQDGNGYIEVKKNPFKDTESVEWANEAITELYSLGVISGKSETSFAPQDTVTREEFTKMIVLAFLEEGSDDEITFPDVSGWSEEYISLAASKGIVTGFENGNFEPKGNITREQAATIVVRALSFGGFSAEKYGNAFTDDTDISAWAKESVRILSGEGILSGRDTGAFCPKDNMTRAEAAKIIYYSMKLTGGMK